MFIQVLVEVLVNVTLKNVRGAHQVCRTFKERWWCTDEASNV